MFSQSNGFYINYAAFAGRNCVKTSCASAAASIDVACPGALSEWPGADNCDVVCPGALSEWPGADNCDVVVALLAVVAVGVCCCLLLFSGVCCCCC